MSASKTPIRTDHHHVRGNLDDVPRMVSKAGEILTMTPEQLAEEKAKLDRPALFDADWIVIAPATAVYLRALADVLDQANVRVAAYTAH